VANQVQEFLTLPEVAKHYRTTPATVRYWRHIGYGPRAVKSGTRLLYPRTEIDRHDQELLSELGGGARAS
jgi:DNA-binding transcriptional MerR regulator